MFVERRDPLGWVMKALREAGNSVASEFSGLDEETLCRRPAEGELSLKEIAAHLRDYEQLAARQVASLLEHPEKRVPVWDVEALPAEHDYLSAGVREVLAEFRKLRRDTTYLLWGLADDDWRRPARHPYRDDFTLEVIARELAQHDLEHLWQVRRLKAALGAMTSVDGDPDDDWDGR